MKNVNVYGIYRRRQPAAVRHPRLSPEGARRLSRQGPRPRRERHEASSSSRAPPARPRAWCSREYDVPLDADAGLPANFVQNDGSDWSLGTPSVMIPGWGVHDAWLDFQGDLWFTCNIPNKQITIGRITTKTGAVKLFAVPAPQGLMAQTHGMTRDPNGIIWFNVNPGRGGIGRIDPKTERDRRVHSAARHVADRRRHHRRLRRQGQDLVVVAGRRAALRSGHRPVHRIQVDHLQDAERHRRHLWRRRRPRRQRLVGRDGARHHRQGQHGDRQGRGGQACAGEGRARSRHAGSARSSTRPTTSPTSTARCRGRRVRAAWAPTRPTTCCGSAIPGARNLARIDTKTNETSYVPLPERPAALPRRMSTSSTGPGPTCGAPTG